MFVSTNFFPCFKSIMFRYDFRRNCVFLDIIASLIKITGETTHNLPRMIFFIMLDGKYWGYFDNHSFSVIDHFYDFKFYFCRSDFS